MIDPLPIAGGSGATFWDYTGKEYLDFASQLVNLNLGHQHPRLVESIQRQAGRLATIAPAFANDVRGELARLVAERAPGTLNKVFFTNGGTEAVEHAVRMARHHTGRRKVLAAYRSYHGGTTTSMSLTGEPRRWANDPGDNSVVHFFGPYAYRSVFHSTTPEEETQRALEHLSRSSTWRARPPSPRSSWNRWSAPTVCWCPRRATWPASGRSVTGTAWCSSPTR